MARTLDIGATWPDEWAEPLVVANAWVVGTAVIAAHATPSDRRDIPLILMLLTF